MRMIDMTLSIGISGASTRRGNEASLQNMAADTIGFKGA